MTEEQIIEKATRALIALGFRNPGERNRWQEAPHVIRATDPLLLEYDEELKTTYSVSFPYRLPDGYTRSTFVKVDSKTHKLIRIITKHGSMDVPEELQ